ncbi:28S ribosomal protein S18c, mitochondrial-like [Mya arenaria]|uniref:28S ribosomal protein S18c, mitochondrial-like n=1 Tax=Mya arenaria TaxID=6604 RepID=UPI0022E5CF42|nr:28S ribosomal protein S18c, mitochondrial-like [Mya arenaria]
MAASMVHKGKLTFSKLSAFQRLNYGPGLIRFLRSVRNPNQDLRPEHVEANSPEAVQKEPGRWKKYTNHTFWRKQRELERYAEKVDEFNVEKLNTVLEQMNISTEIKDDMPVDMPDPFQPPRKKCILCEYDVKLDYKNPQLLSQFISPYTGRIYGRHVTGLCLFMQRQLAREIRISRFMGFLPSMNKPAKYLEDPMLFNPFSRKN